MLRQVLIEAALFLVPFAIYAAILATRGRAVGTGDAWREAPLAWLAIGGLVLVAIGLAMLALLNDDAGNGAYVPTHIENGTLVPGHFEK
ncbi:DUF6111 family protein [Prosthecomicrobium sp. N25]|uniref:DUF6111 family protein n=1 Tax=Prosthecomicrobium sp. N25 TaxID=3129254 RepID=UPI003078A44C